MATAPLPQTATLVVWEPLPFFTEELSTPSYGYSEVQLTRSDGRLYFDKVVTNTGSSDGSFVFLVSYL